MCLGSRAGCSGLRMLECLGFRGLGFRVLRVKGVGHFNTRVAVPPQHVQYPNQRRFAPNANSND